MSDATIAALVIAGMLTILALVEWWRRVQKAKHRRTLSDMYQPAPKPKTPPPDKE